MYDRDDLAEVYYDLPRTPALGLFDFVLDVLTRRDEAELQSFHVELARDSSRPKELAPSDLVESLKGLLDPDFPDHPFSWHVQRLALRSAMGAVPTRGWQVAKQRLETHQVALRPFVEAEPERFLLTGLRLERLNERARDHLARWIGRDVGAVACLPTGAEEIAKLPRSSMSVAARCVLPRVFEEGAPDPQDPTTWVLPRDGDLAEAVRWIGAALRACPEWLRLVFVENLPARVSLAEEASADDADDDPFRRRRLGYPLLDLRRVQLPSDADEAVSLVAEVVARQPHLAPVLAGLLPHGVKPPASAAVRALAGAAPELFEVVLQRGWGEGLRGAAELVPHALALSDLDTRVNALLALGEPAAQALGALADDLLAGLSDPAHPLRGRGGLLTRIANEGVALGLPFWFKRLERPGAFPHLWSSRRLREALTLRPDPVYRLVRRAAERDDRAGGGAILRALVGDWDTFSLEPVSAEVVRLLRVGSPELHWKTRLTLLACVGTPEALAVIEEVLEDVTDDDLTAGSRLYPPAWDALVRLRHVTGTWLVEELLERKTVLLGQASVAAVVDALLDKGLSSWSSRARDEASRASPEELLLSILKEHAEALGPERVAAAKAALQGLVSAEDLASVGRRPWVEEHAVPPLPWASLSEADRGYLLPEIGLWLAARVADPAWMRINLGEELRPAVVARFRDALGPQGEAILADLGDRWPTRAAVEESARRLGVVLPSKALDRCADEAIPPVFRAALARLPDTIHASDDTRWADEHWIVRWVFEGVWADAPELLARHLVPVFEQSTKRVWRRGLALALVALREPCGTTVPDALTRARHEAAEPDEQAFYQRQRDTFARAHAAREQSAPAEARTREALVRLRRYARMSRGVA